MAFPFSNAPKPPYYAVVFTSTRRTYHNDGYNARAERMVELAQQQPGYLGIESMATEIKSIEEGNGEGEEHGITVSYWADEESVRGWKRQVEHQAAQKEGKKKWYKKFELRIAKVERAYGFESDQVQERQESASL